MANGKSTLQFFQNYATTVKIDRGARPVYREIAEELRKGKSVTCFMDGKPVIIKLDANRNVVIEEKETKSDR